MRVIELTQGKVTLVDDADFDRLNRFKWYAMRRKNTFYAVRKSSLLAGPRKNVGMHADIFGFVPAGTKVDHINQDGLDNRRENLRVATKSQNAANARKRKGTSSRYRGVSRIARGAKWEAQIGHNYGVIHLGRFGREEDAARAYDAAARRLFGIFARTNFSETGFPKS